MSANNNNENTFKTIFMALVAGLVLAAMVNGCNSTTTVAPTVDRSSPEYRYAKERVRLEGYSDKESAQAAEAIIKFHNAQKNR